MKRSAIVMMGSLLFFVSGCGKPNAFVEPPPPEVTVASPVELPVTEYLEFTGLAQPLETVEIRARVKGILKERHFVDGAIISKGQLLLVIDEEPYKIRLESAKAQYKEAQAALEQAKVSRAREVAQSQVNLSQAQIDLAMQEEKRVRNLFEKKATSESAMDEASAALKAREAELESAQASLLQSNATYETAILSGQAKLKSAEIAVQSAELDLSYCRMTAPIDGQISRINVDVGNLISDSGSVVLATIVRMDPMYAYATISEHDLSKLPSLRAAVKSTLSAGEVTATSDPAASSVRVPTELGLQSDSGYPLTGNIDYTDPGLDPETGTLRIRGVFSNQDGRLLPGMFVKMRISLAEHPHAMLISERALGADQSGRYVLVVDADNRVQYRPVKTGVAKDGMRVIIGELTTSDKVIIEGLLRARPGAKVVPMDAPESKAAATNTAAPETEKSTSKNP